MRISGRDNLAAFCSLGTIMRQANTTSHLKSDQYRTGTMWLPIILLFAIGAVVALPAAVATTATIPLTHDQIQGMPPLEKTCKKQQHVLAERPDGRLACVYESTAEKLGWMMITMMIQAENMSKMQNTNDTGPHTVAHQADSHWSSDDFPSLPLQSTVMPEYNIFPMFEYDLFPDVEVQMPKTTPLNESLTVTINYDFTPKKGLKFDPEKILPPPVPDPLLMRV